MTPAQRTLGAIFYDNFELLDNYGPLDDVSGDRQVALREPWPAKLVARREPRPRSDARSRRSRVAR